MAKRFNITGKCIPAEHYVADVSEKLEAVKALVDRGEYFIINRPRQYGKTTMLFSLADRLRKTGDYVVFDTSFEGIDDQNFKDEKNLAAGFVRLLGKSMAVYAPDEAAAWLASVPTLGGLDALSDFVTIFLSKIDQRVVVLIDEVDQSSNNELFVKFLAMLRNKYLIRDKIKTFHAVVLAGVHDVKSLKLKLRPNEERKYNSPWNIAADFKVDMNLQPSEIIPMLNEYGVDKGVKMNSKKIATHLFYYTSGYPFLVSKLCKMLDEADVKLHKKNRWTNEDVDTAARQLVRESNVNFDSLIKNLEDNTALYDSVYNLAVDAETRTFNINNPVTNLGVLYGIFADRKGLAIHNRIYREVIVDYMTDKMHETQIARGADFGGGFKNPDKSINMETVLTKFQTFMREQYSRKDRAFLERNGRLVFLAYIKPIINGSGYDFKEPQISDERRLDVLITYLQHRYLAELKIWRGEVAHQEGLMQLSDYLNRLGLMEGYLIIFDHAKVKSWKKEWIEYDGKRIFAVWV